ncbi:hypothetical protein [uncultured Christiangramia sp.]|uniref:hypothetical protein n=1 Tax=uncultured Christiangramia sp. TaxID=503836 RepID=UPI00262F6F01|nr:hypothetical protein [uncultured Christiangramia sp.]
MPSSILHIIQDYATQTDNKCGLTAVSLCQQSGSSISEVRKELNDLFKTGKIKVREGIHGKLIFNK